MVAEVVPDPRQVLDNGNVESVELVGGADTGEEEDVGSTNGSGTENDLIGIDGKHLFTAYDKQTSGPVAIEYDAVDQAIRADGEVEAVSGGVEISDGGAHPDSVYYVEREGADTGAVGAVVVGAVRKPLSRAAW